MSRETKAKQIQHAISETLQHHWDPIGVQDEPEARYEYGMYVGNVYRLLASGASDEEIIRFLRSQEAKLVGTARPDGQLASCVRALRRIDLSLE
jgi:hypothetical protein